MTRRDPAHEGSHTHRAENPRLPSTTIRSEVATSVTEWFHTFARDLVFRRNRNAYRVWLAETMLQQTQVSRASEYFLRFLARYPTVHDLARAPLDDVMAMWAGLGYYARGRNLHACAQQVVARYGGTFPNEARELESLPGIGPYTAAALCAFAFGKSVAVVDGNVERVLARVFDDDTPVNTPGGKARFLRFAESLVDVAVEPAVMSEAVMELGATVCTPRAPACHACPISHHCLAVANGTVTTLPQKTPKAARTVLDVVVLLPVAEDRVWLVRNPARGLFGGLLVPPNRVRLAPRTESTTRVREATVCVDGEFTALAATLGVTHQLTQPFYVERHLTHRTLRIHAERVDVIEMPLDAGAFYPARNIESLGIPSAFLHAVRAIL